MAFMAISGVISVASSVLLTDAVARGLASTLCPDDILRSTPRSMRQRWYRL